MSPWPDIFMQMAHVIATRSKDTTQVGCVITDPSNRVVSCGFNGAPSCMDPFAESVAISDQTLKHSVVVHAEVNAILFARRDLTGCTLYCTHHPCEKCAPIIAQAGITAVVHGGGTLRSDHGIARAVALFDSCSIKVIQHGKH